MERKVQSEPEPTNGMPGLLNASAAEYLGGNSERANEAPPTPRNRDDRPVRPYWTYTQRDTLARLLSLARDEKDAVWDQVFRKDLAAIERRVTAIESLDPRDDGIISQGEERERESLLERVRDVLEVRNFDDTDVDSVAPKTLESLPNTERRWNMQPPRTLGLPNAEHGAAVSQSNPTLRPQALLVDPAPGKTQLPSPNAPAGEDKYMTFRRMFPEHASADDDTVRGLIREYREHERMASNRQQQSQIPRDDRGQQRRAEHQRQSHRDPMPADPGQQNVTRMERMSSPRLKMPKPTSMNKRKRSSRSPSDAGLFLAEHPTRVEGNEDEQQQSSDEEPLLAAYPRDSEKPDRYAPNKAPPRTSEMSPSAMTTSPYHSSKTESQLGAFAHGARALAPSSMHDLGPRRQAEVETGEHLPKRAQQGPYHSAQESLDRSMFTISRSPSNRTAPPATTVGNRRRLVEPNILGLNARRQAEAAERRNAITAQNAGVPHAVPSGHSVQPGPRTQHSPLPSAMQNQDPVAGRPHQPPPAQQSTQQRSSANVIDLTMLMSSSDSE